MDPTISYRSQSRAMLQAPSLKAASQGLDVRKSVPPCGGREVFFLDILFYRTFPPHDGYYVYTDISNGRTTLTFLMGSNMLCLSIPRCREPLHYHQSQAAILNGVNIANFPCW